MDYLRHLEADYRRLAAVCAGRLTEPVPTCPEWTVDDLLRHVAAVYLHKVECMRQGALPKPWPPDLSGEPASSLLARAYAALRAEFAGRAPSSPAYTFYGPDQTVGFWVRRMAHETVIHRIDGELAGGMVSGEDSLPIPEELAVDGIDELLRVFMSWASREWPEDFTEILAAGAGSVGIGAILIPPAPAETSWLVSWGPDGVTVDTEVDQPAPAAISGPADAVMRWLWRRSDSGVTVAGDESQVAQMRQLLAAATQ